MLLRCNSTEVTKLTVQDSFDLVSNSSIFFVFVFVE